jgi:hypothetical protein
VGICVIHAQRDQVINQKEQLPEYQPGQPSGQRNYSYDPFRIRFYVDVNFFISQFHGELFFFYGQRSKLVQKSSKGIYALKVMTLKVFFRLYRFVPLPGIMLLRVINRDGLL